MYKLAIFDMDGTLLQGRTIFHIAARKGFTDKLIGFMNSSLQPYEKTFKIASLLKGISRDEILSFFHEIPFRPNVEELVDSLKKQGYILALATDSYDLVVNDLKNRLKFDYAFANNLLFHDLICTGEVRLHNTNLLVDDITKKVYSISKLSILEKLCKKHQISLEDSIAIGDGMVDCGMLKKAGLGIAVFAPIEVKKCADMVTNDLMEILSFIKR
jgi:phosphoserine phosphatase SerB